MTNSYEETARRLGVPEADITARRYSEKLIADLDLQFPDVDPGGAPLGGMIIVQERRALPYFGSIIRPDDTKDSDQAKTPVARVVSLGQGTFREWKSGELWVGAPWVVPGDYVVIPRISDMKWKRPVPGGGDDAVFRMVLDKHHYMKIDDFDLVSKFTAVAA